MYINLSPQTLTTAGKKQAVKQDVNIGKTKEVDEFQHLPARQKRAYQSVAPNG